MDGAGGRSGGGGPGEHRGTPYQFRERGPDEWGARILGTGGRARPGDLVTVQTRGGQVRIQRVSRVVRVFDDGNAVVETVGARDELPAGGGCAPHSGVLVELPGGGWGAELDGAVAGVRVGDRILVRDSLGEAREKSIRGVLQGLGDGRGIVEIDGGGGAAVGAGGGGGSAAHQPDQQQGNVDVPEATGAAAVDPVDRDGGVGGDAGGNDEDFTPLPF